MSKGKQKAAQLAERFHGEVRYIPGMGTRIAPRWRIAIGGREVIEVSKTGRVTVLQNGRFAPVSADELDAVVAQALEQWR